MITIIELANDKGKRNKVFSKLFGYEFCFNRWSMKLQLIKEIFL